jgi:hypothetical protein
MVLSFSVVGVIGKFYIFYSKLKISGKKFNFTFGEMETNPDRQALDADPDPQNFCNLLRNLVHFSNTHQIHKYSF